MAVRAEEHVANALRRPSSRHGIVQRNRLVDELRSASDAPVLLVVGGGGFGKTTIVSQWLSDDPRSVGWLTATRQQDDPAMLLADVVRVLDELEPLDPRAKQQLATVAVDFSSVLVPRLERIVAERARPFVLVIDDAHLLRRQMSWALVQALADRVPAGSQLVLISRTQPQLKLGRMRADRRVHTIGSRALAFDRGEAAALFEIAGLAVPVSQVDRLWQRTEGWPVGLYLATLAIAEEDDPVHAAEQFAGDDRLVVDYVQDELLAVLPRGVRQFLLQSSLLEELTAPACDAVLDRDDSDRLLSEVAGSLQLLIPVDRRRTTYRMHQLMRETLRGELRRRQPQLERVLHARAARWYEAGGDYDRAVEHWKAADDRERLEAVIWKAVPPFAGAGLTATVDRWLEDLTIEEITASPVLTVAKAWCALTDGDMGSLRHWAAVASAMGDDVELPDGNPVAASAALLRAVVGANGIEEMRQDAARAYALDRVGSPFRSVARYLEGAALRIEGRAAEARDRLLEGEALGAMGVPATQAHCLAQLAALAVEENDWDGALRFVTRFDGVLERFALRERPAMGGSLAITALVHAHSGDSGEARIEAKHALFLVSMLATVAPWINLEARVHLARTFLLLGDVGMARTLTREGIEMLALVPDAPALQSRLALVEQATEAEHVPIGVLATPMTPAEMRVLRYLPTHLTFAAIAAELFVSRNTVKTQAISIYRKLNVSSRDPAVVAARSLGLLDE